MLIILISFLSGECVDDGVNIQTNYQFTPAVVIHFMNWCSSVRVLFIYLRFELHTAC